MVTSAHRPCTRRQPTPNTYHGCRPMQTHTHTGQQTCRTTAEHAPPSQRHAAVIARLGVPHGKFCQPQPPREQTAAAAAAAALSTSRAAEHRTPQCCSKQELEGGASAAAQRERIALMHARGCKTANAGTHGVPRRGGKGVGGAATLKVQCCEHAANRTKHSWPDAHAPLVRRGLSTASTLGNMQRNATLLVAPDTVGASTACARAPMRHTHTHTHTHP
jgi:hypothetical protein